MSQPVAVGSGESDDRPILIDARTAARLLSISPRTLWSLTHSGVVPCVRLGRSVRYAPAVLKYLAKSGWTTNSKKGGE
jgi:excisionase family DNA binding protein